MQSLVLGTLGTSCVWLLHQIFVPPLVAPDPGVHQFWILSTGLIVALAVTLTCAILTRRELLTPQKFDDECLSTVIRIIYGAVGAALLFMWAFIGFVVWILLLARAFNRLLMAVLRDILTGAGDWIGDAQRGLDIAGPFYTNGFIKITAAVREKWSESWMPQRFPWKAATREEAPNLLVAIICLAVGAVSLFAWAIVGLVFWIPLLVRTTVLFFVAVLRDSITGGDEVARRAQLGLDASIPPCTSMDLSESLRHFADRPQPICLGSAIRPGGDGWRWKLCGPL